MENSLVVRITRRARVQGIRQAASHLVHPRELPEIAHMPLRPIQSFLFFLQSCRLFDRAWAGIPRGRLPFRKLRPGSLLEHV